MTRPLYKIFYLLTIHCITFHTVFFIEIDNDVMLLQYTMMHGAISCCFFYYPGTLSGLVMAITHPVMVNAISAYDRVIEDKSMVPSLGEDNSMNGPLETEAC